MGQERVGMVGTGRAFHTPPTSHVASSAQDLQEDTEEGEMREGLWGWRGGENGKEIKLEGVFGYGRSDLVPSRERS